ncbi:MAG: hypothetical protein IJ691_00050 [Lachnospiraceae bacterium]|nr:hypothetical protein [Lachnospiraceae bacterium]
MMNKRIILVLLSTVLILAGVSIYLLLNKTALLSKAIFSFVTPVNLDIGDSPFIKVINNFGADFLWSMGFSLAIQSVLFLRRKRVWLLLLCSVLGIVYELLQFLEIANGTADTIDVIVYIIGCTFGILFILGGKFYEKD